MAHYAVAPSVRRWPRRILIGLNFVVAFVLVSVAVVYFYVQWTFGGFDKLDLGLGDNGNDQPMNVLLVGSDSREGNVGADDKSFGSASKVGGQRSDTMMILRIEPETKKAMILSIPRDLYVDIAGTGGKDRINAAFNAGGAERLIETIEQNFDVPIHHYVQVDFQGFRGVVDTVGGVTVNFPYRARDYDRSIGRTHTGLNVEAGCQELNGEMSLAYVRSRYYQEYKNGRWVADPSGDFGRITRQQTFIRLMISSAINKGARNPATLTRLIGKAHDHVQIDDTLDERDMIDIAKEFKDLDPAKVEMFTVSGQSARENGASVVRFDAAAAEPVLARFREVTTSETPAVAADTIRVQILNGSGINGQGRDAKAGLLEHKVQVQGEPGNTEAPSYGTTVLRYAPGQSGKAKSIQALVEGRSTVQEDSTLRGVDVVLITGKTYAGIVDPGTPPPPPSATSATATPTTTAPPAATC